MAACICLAVAAVCSGQTNQPPSVLKEQKFALVVGVGNYGPDSRFDKLDYAADDAKDLAAILKRNGYDSDLLIDANRVSVRRHISQLLAKVDSGNGGTIIFAFSGHGGQANDIQYLALTDADAGDLGETGLSVQEIQDQLKKAEVPRKILFLDACRTASPNATGPKPKAAGVPSWTELQAAKGFRILNATGSEMLSYEDPSLHHGVFTNYLIEGLQGKAAGRNGLVTFETLVDYVKQNVQNFRRDQVPYARGEYSGDFYLAGQPKAERPRRALVLANQSYAPAKLGEPGHSLLSTLTDGQAVAAQLKTLGFEVTQAFDQQSKGMAETIKAFSTNLGDNDVALVYYSGAGAMADGDPRLLPTDVAIGDEQAKTRGVSHPRFEGGISLVAMLDLLKSRSGPTILALDMCLTGEGAGVFDLKRLYRDNTLMLFAAMPGQLASETAKGGLFSLSFIKLIGDPAMSTLQLYGELLNSVQQQAAKTSANQFPTTIGKLHEPFYFSPQPQ